MAAGNPISLKTTLRNLKEIISTLNGDDHENVRLIQEMESLAVKIENKITPPGSAASAAGGAAIN